MQFTLLLHSNSTTERKASPTPTVQLLLLNKEKRDRENDDEVDEQLQHTSILQVTNYHPTDLGPKF